MGNGQSNNGAVLEAPDGLGALDEELLTTLKKGLTSGGLWTCELVENVAQ